MPITKKTKANKLRLEKIKAQESILEDSQLPVEHITGGMLKEIFVASKNNPKGTISIQAFSDYLRIHRITLYNRFSNPLKYLKPVEQEAVFKLFTAEEINQGIKAYNQKYGINSIS